VHELFPAIVYNQRVLHFVQSLYDNRRKNFLPMLFLGTFAKTKNDDY